MDKLFTSKQIREADAYTIEHEPITAIDLMERASKAFVTLFESRFPDKTQRITVVCGQGNNGGDGLAIARLLEELAYDSVSVIFLKLSQKQSQENQINFERLKLTSVSLQVVSQLDEINLNDPEIIIDAILGSGLNKPLEDKIAKLVELINAYEAKVVSVDVPTGFASEGELPKAYYGIKSDLTISFQKPKINFFFPESAVALEAFEVVAIGLSQEFIHQQDTSFQLITEKDVNTILKPRQRFTHKGTYGHALIAAGATDTMGAAILCAHACLKTGAGLTTLRCPEGGLSTLNAVLPEVMALPTNIKLQNADLKKYSALAFGPGWGISEENESLLLEVLKLETPIVLDADALTILSHNIASLTQLAANTIITPHMKEFDRLFGDHDSWWQRVETAKQKAKDLKIVIVLKNQYTFIALPNGLVCINSTGNPAMAQGGMGDTLTGIIVSLLAQKYTIEEAAILGVWLHGKAGDKLAEQQFVVSASEIAHEIPLLMKSIIESS